MIFSFTTSDFSSSFTFSLVFTGSFKAFSTDFSSFAFALGINKLTPSAKARLALIIFLFLFINFLLLFIFLNILSLNIIYIYIVKLFKYLSIKLNLKISKLFPIKNMGKLINFTHVFGVYNKSCW